MERVLRDRTAILLFVGPAFLLYIIVVFIPILWSMGYTVFEGNPIAGFKFVGVANYLKIFQDRDFLNALLFSLKYAVLVSAGQVFFGLLLALLYAYYLKRASALVRTLVFFPVVLPTVAVAAMYSKLFAISPQNGIVNTVLELLNIAPVAWLGQAGTAFWVIIIMDIWKAMGFYAVLLYTGLVDIPTEVIESAGLDGAEGWTMTRFIITPLIAPLIVTSLIFSLNGTLKVFESVLALTNGGPGSATTPLTMYMFKSAFTFNQYGYGSTVALMLTLECLLVTLAVYRFARQDVTA